jgi:hypothetical protein
MPFDLREFTLTDTIRCGTELRRIIRDASTVEEAAQSACEFLFDALEDPRSREPSAVLVRCYKTHSYADLPTELQGFARNILKRKPGSRAMKCLTLLGTAGSRPEWKDRNRSIGHRAIPLESVEMVEQAPMVAQLIRQLGLDVAAVIAPTPDILRQMEGKSYGVFHVPRAQGSPFIPAQAEFVLPQRIQSVLGFGGLLRNGDMLAFIVFSRTPISEETANRFRTIALDIRATLFSAGEIPTFRAEVE